MDECNELFFQTSAAKSSLFKKVNRVKISLLRDRGGP
jgi:hypothetical protein